MTRLMTQFAAETQFHHNFLQERPFDMVIGLHHVQIEGTKSFILILITFHEMQALESCDNIVRNEAS